MNEPSVTNSRRIGQFMEYKWVKYNEWAVSYKLEENWGAYGIKGINCNDWALSLEHERTRQFMEYTWLKYNDRALKVEIEENLDSLWYRRVKWNDRAVSVELEENWTVFGIEGIKCSDWTVSVKMAQPSFPCISNHLPIAVYAILSGYSILSLCVSSPPTYLLKRNIQVAPFSLHDQWIQIVVSWCR